MDFFYLGHGPLGWQTWQQLASRRHSDPAGLSALGLAHAATRRAAPALPASLVLDEALLDHATGVGQLQALPWRAADGSGGPPRRLCVVADPDTPAGAQWLAQWPALRREGVPEGVEVVLLLPAPPPSELALKRVPGAGTLCVLPAPAGAVDDAATRATRLVGALLHGPGGAGPDLPAFAPAAPLSARLCAVVEARSDLVAVRQHLVDSLLQRVVAQLRFDHWRAPQGYVDGAAPAAPAQTDGEVASAWWSLEGLDEPDGPDGPTSVAHPPPLTLTEAQRQWQRLAAHYRTLVQACERSRRPAELRRLFQIGCDEQFAGVGIARACRGSEARVQARARRLAAAVEAVLWADWSAARLSLQGVQARLAAGLRGLAQQSRTLQAQIDRDDALAERLHATATAAAGDASSATSWWAGRGNADGLGAVASALQGWALARTGAAIGRAEQAHLVPVQTALAGVLAMVEATDLALGTLGSEAAARALAALPDEAAQANPHGLRLDLREQSLALCRTWVLSAAVQREQVMRVRAGVFFGFAGDAGDAPTGWRTLAERLGEGDGPVRLRAACDRLIDAPVVSSVATATVQALARRWQNAPAERLAQLLLLRAQATAALAGWPDGGMRTETVLLPPALLPEAVAVDDGDPDPDAPLRALADALDADAAARGTLVVRRVAADGPRLGSLIWRTETASVPLPLPAVRMVAETSADDAARRLADRRSLLLLGEALGAVREAQRPDGGMEIVRAVLDDDGLELDLLPLAPSWAQAPAALDAAGEAALQATLAPLLGTLRLTERLRETLQQRVAHVRTTAAPHEAERLGHDWAASARQALSQLRDVPT
jgi:hypothetical protein